MAPNNKPSSGRSATPGRLSRRRFLTGSTAAVTGAALPLATRPIMAEHRTHHSESFRMVFMTDIHWQDQHGAPEALAKALASLQRLDPTPELIVNGGDLVHNSKGMTVDSGERSADRFLASWRANTDLPTYHAMGNHDPLGWANPEVSPNEPLFGWDLWREKLGRDRLYYSFDHGGWHFVVLHDIALTERGHYIGEFDDQQMRWLKRDLAHAGDRPTMLFGHMPPVSAIEFLDGGAAVEDGDWTLSVTRMTRNPDALLQALEGSRAQAFWSGHIHRRDRIDALGLSMICAGAISGAWWGGPNGATQEGYAVIDCHADGSFDYYYHDYGWQPPS